MKGKDLDLLHELAPVDGSHSTVKGGRRLLKHHFYFLAFKPTYYFAIWQETDKQTRHVIYSMKKLSIHLATHIIKKKCNTRVVLVIINFLVTSFKSEVLFCGSALA